MVYLVVLDPPLAPHLIDRPNLERFHHALRLGRIEQRRIPGAGPGLGRANAAPQRGSGRRGGYARVTLACVGSLTPTLAH